MQRPLPTANALRGVVAAASGKPAAARAASAAAQPSTAAASAAPAGLLSQQAPTDAHREVTEDAYELRGQCGFSFGDGCMPSDDRVNLFGGIKLKNNKPKVGSY